jgi:hypothetical protein
MFHMKPCPKCGSTSEATVWPYLKGIDADNKKIEWRRCSKCNALFSDLTEVTVEAVSPRA